MTFCHFSFILRWAALNPLIITSLYTPVDYFKEIQALIQMTDTENMKSIIM